MRAPRATWLLWTVAAVVALATGAALPGAAGFATDAAFSNLKFFGPTASDAEWRARDMQLVADYTWRIGPIDLSAGQQCLFVNVLLPGGDPDWKDGKLGTGTTPAQLLVGGGNIVIAQRGLWNLTVTTPSAAQPLTLTRTGLDLYPTATFAPAAGGFVQTAADVALTVTFSAAVTTAALSAASFVVQPANSPVTAGWSVAVVDATRATVRFPALQRDPSRAVTAVSVTLVAGAVNATAGAQHPNTAVTFAFLYEPYAGAQPAWRGLFGLRDDTTFFTDQKPSGGWYVTPVHLQTLSASGHVLVTGWSRRQNVGCTGFGSRVHGISFVLDPATLDVVTSPASPYAVLPISEDPRFLGNPTSDPVQSADVMYCSGHCALGDGRKLFVGGAEYWDVSTAREKESGLNYGRVFDPATGAIARIPFNFTGRAWYPTATLLASGNVLVARGFTDYNTAACTGDRCASPGLWLLNRAELDAGTANPWHTLVDDTAGPPDINPAVTDYTRTFVLHQPVTVAGVAYDVALVGQAGRVMLLCTDGVAAGQVTAQPNAARPAWPAGSPYGCGSGSAANGALLAPTGEVVLVGPCAYVDLYNAATDTWRRFDTGVVRNKPASLLLPTGDILLLNGENPTLDQSAAGVLAGDPRHAQLLSLDATTGNVTTFTAREPEGAFRGYHNAVALLKDGAVLTGGGTSNQGGIGCEHSTMRLFRPPYLTVAAATHGRPVLDPRNALGRTAPWVWYQPSAADAVTRDRSSVTFEFAFDAQAAAGTRLRAVRGAALLATSAFTHGSCQNQRYVELQLTTVDGGAGATTADGAPVHTATVTLPSTPTLFPGEYLLFVVTGDGVPSVGQAVQLRTLPTRANAAGGGSGVSGWTTVGVLLASFLLVGVFS